MALIKCPECGKEVSDKAAKCPNCGMKIAEQGENKEKKAEKGEKNVLNEAQSFAKKNPLAILVGVVVVVLVIVAIATKGFGGFGGGYQYEIMRSEDDTTMYVGMNYKDKKLDEFYMKISEKVEGEEDPQKYCELMEKLATDVVKKNMSCAATKDNLTLEYKLSGDDVKELSELADGFTYNEVDDESEAEEEFKSLVKQIDTCDDKNYVKIKGENICK